MLLICSNCSTDSLSTNTTYLWRVSLFNGNEWAQSEIFNFTTRLIDCSSIPCVSGTCAEDTLKCDCDFGWSGDDCSVPPKNDGIYFAVKFYYVQIHPLFLSLLECVLEEEFC